MILLWGFVKGATQKKLLYVNWNLLGELHSVEIEASGIKRVKKMHLRLLIHTPALIFDFNFNALLLCII